jgi:hypothetical protein
MFSIKPAFSQQSSNSFTGEIFSFQNLEKSLSPLVNLGPGIRLGYNYGNTAETTVNTYSLILAIANPKASVESSRRSIFGSITGSFNHLKKLANTELLIGYHFSASYKDGFYKNIDQSHLYWANFIGGGFSAAYVKKLNNSKSLSVDFKIPLLGIVSRSPDDRLYKVDDPSFGNVLSLNHQNLMFATVGNYIQPVAKIEYTTLINKSNSLGIFYRCEYVYSKTKNTSSYKEFQNGLGIHFTINNH